MEMKYLFVPYEQAVALEEIEFDEPCLAGYNFKDRRTGQFTYPSAKEPNTTSEARVYHKDKKIVEAPLYQQAFRWFRKNHNLVYQINYLYNGNYQVVIHKNTHEYMELIQDLEHACVDEIPDNYSYEEAELECLKKLIEIVKKK